MNIRLFYHSLLSDWNHGNAHFLRGVAIELIARGHDVLVYEPVDNWSLQHLRADHGEAPIEEFRRAYPNLRSEAYDVRTFDFDAALSDADLVIVHEWNDPAVVHRVATARREHDFVLFFHDTHHRLLTDAAAMRAHDLSAYDGVLAYGQVLRDLYLQQQLCRAAWTWHEAADTRVFFPRPRRQLEGDLVWIGNWGDDERTEELQEFLINPVRELGLRARVYGVRYPDSARALLAEAGIEYAGWLPNFRAPEIFAGFKVTVHVPRRPYVQTLRGIPTIRPFEALACGIALISAPWSDAEHLFSPGKDFLFADSGAAMKVRLVELLQNDAQRAFMVAHGLATLQSRHTCAHRVTELLQIYESVRAAQRTPVASSVLV